MLRYWIFGRGGAKARTAIEKRYGTSQLPLRGGRCPEGTPLPNAPLPQDKILVCFFRSKSRSAREEKNWSIDFEQKATIIEQIYFATELLVFAPKGLQGSNAKPRGQIYGKVKQISRALNQSIDHDQEGNILIISTCLHRGHPMASTSLSLPNLMCPYSFRDDKITYMNQRVTRKMAMKVFEVLGPPSSPPLNLLLRKRAMRQLTAKME